MAKKNGKQKSRRNTITSAIRKIESGAKRSIPLVALAAPAAASILTSGMNEGGLVSIVRKYTGYQMQQQTFEPAALLEGWGPFVAAKVVTKVINMLR